MYPICRICGYHPCVCPSTIQRIKAIEVEIEIKKKELIELRKKRKKLIHERLKELIPVIVKADGE